MQNIIIHHIWYACLLAAILDFVKSHISRKSRVVWRQRFYTCQKKPEFCYFQDVRIVAYGCCQSAIVCLVSPTSTRHLLYVCPTASDLRHIVKILPSRIITPREAEYCDHRVYSSVCLSLCLSAWTKLPIFTKFLYMFWHVVLNRCGHWGVYTCVHTCSLSRVELRYYLRPWLGPPLAA